MNLDKKDFKIEYRGRSRTITVVTVTHIPDGFSFKGVVLLANGRLNFFWPAEAAGRGTSGRMACMISFLEGEGAFHDDEMFAAMNSMPEDAGGDNVENMVASAMDAIRKTLEEEKNDHDENDDEPVRRISIRLV